MHKTQSEQVEGPPQPPKISRSIHLKRSHLPLQGVLVLIVVLALLGVFGLTRGQARERAEALEIVVEHPARLRYKTIAPLRVHVRNLTDAPMDTVIVRFDRSYLDPFSSVSFTPSASAVWVVTLESLKPGEQRRIQGGVQAERYGWHEGSVVARTGADSVQVAVGTFVFP